MTSWPCSARSAAATEESTPPDIATTIRILRTVPGPRRHENTKVHEEENMLAFFVRSSCPCVFVVPSGGYRLSRQAAQFVHQPRQHLDDAVDFLRRGKHPDAEAQRVLGPARPQSHRLQHVRLP